MFPETTLFGVLIVLAILFTLIFLLIRKPHFGFKGTPSGADKEEKELRNHRQLTQTPRTHPRRFEYPIELPEKTTTLQEPSSSAKTAESQIKSDTPPTSTHEEETPEKTKTQVQTAETPKKPPEPVEAPKVTEERQVPIPSTLTQLRPPSCTHFFGYLRKIPKNVSMPDECFGCPKMVECLYYNITPE